jgi:hypothetical protein
MKTLALLLACCLPAFADEVVLKGGGKISGVVEEKDGRVHVRTEHGTIVLPLDRIASVDRAKSSGLQEYEERVAKSDLSKISEVEDLLRWAEQRKMTIPATELQERLFRLKWEAVDRKDSAALETFAAWARSTGKTTAAEEALHLALDIRKAKVGPKDADGFHQLGLWARANGLEVEALIPIPLTGGCLCCNPLIDGGPGRRCECRCHGRPIRR